MSALSRLGAALLRLSRALGDLVGRALLTVFYFTLLVPFAAAVRTFSDPLGAKRRAGEPTWAARRDRGRDPGGADLLAAARRQF